jgi:hypothetical protein
MSYSREWIDARGSEDSHARALWALGTTVGRGDDPGTRSLGSDLFHSALPAVSGFTSPRAWAYTLIGIEEYLRAFEGDRSVQGMRGAIGERLLDLFRRSNLPDWPWFEDRVTYCNARLSQAMLVSGSRMGHDEMISAGLRSLEWLVSIQRSEEGYFAPIGSNGFYERGASRASFDQQPVEACAMISACLDAHRLTGESQWAEHARCAFDWFLGQNQLNQTLYEVTTGGCRDGLHPDRLNENQGAESTLSFLMALAEMRSSDRADLCLPAALVATG